MQKSSLSRLYLCKKLAHAPVPISTNEIKTKEERRGPMLGSRRGEERERRENICLIPTLLPASENKKFGDDSIGRREGIKKG